MVPIPLTFTMTGLEGLPGAHRVAGWCFPPTTTAAFAPSLWLFACPGTGEEHHYFHLEVEGYAPDAYSFAAFFASRGIGVVAIDLPGTGAGAWDCDGSLLTLEVLAQANDQVVTQMRERLREGTLAPQVPPLEQVVIAGIGHSGGGGLCVIQQARHHSFDLLGNLGAACSMAEMPAGSGSFASRFRLENGYVYLDPKALQTPMIYMEDVPAPVRETYERHRVPVPGSLLSIRQPGTLAEYAARVDIPTLLVFGERDISTAPRQEPRFYTQAQDCTLYEQPGAAHHHNLASTRHELWTYIYNWLWAVHRSIFPVFRASRSLSS